MPRGDYSLVALAPTPAEAVTEYGSHLLAFEPQSGPALEAESFGRLVLLAYAGPSGRELQLRRTQGGLRLTVAMVNAIVSRLAADRDLHLRVEALSLTPPPWWAFWRPRPENVRPLSAEPPRLLAPPLDEATLAGHALRSGRRRRLRRYDPDTDTWREPAPTTSGSTSASDTRPEGERGTPFESGGGRFGGAGVTGGWDADPARPPGVDSAGRILGTARGGRGGRRHRSERCGSGRRGPAHRRRRARVRHEHARQHQLLTRRARDVIFAPDFSQSSRKRLRPMSVSGCLSRDCRTANGIVQTCAPSLGRVDERAAGCG